MTTPEESKMRRLTIEDLLMSGSTNEPVKTFLPVTDEMLEDEAQLRSYLDGRLKAFVEHA